MIAPRARHAPTGRLFLDGLTLSVAGFYLLNLARAALDARSAKPLRPLPPASGLPDVAATLPRVSVIVPARDEERNIQRCVTSLLRQDYPQYEVIVVDDASTDATPALLRRLSATPEGRQRLRVTRVEELPAGWAGKPHALHIGAGAATGEWLLFTDADTYHTPTALRSAVTRAVAERADLFTIGTTQELPGFWNRVLMPIAYMGISFMYPPFLVNNPRTPVAIANGQFLLIRRGTYQRLGGYDTDALRATLVDDLALAQTVKRAGGKLLFVDGRGLVTTHMYHSLREHWNGWGKNAVAGSRGGAAGLAPMLLGLPLITCAPLVMLALGLARRRRSLAWRGGMAFGAMVAYRAYLDRLLGIPFAYAFTHPLGGAVFTGILARSFWRKLRGVTVPWRGRTYAA